MRSESMVCVPLATGTRCLGVLVGGVAAWQVPGCQQRDKFMQAFGVQAALALEAAMSERGQARRQLATATEEFREASRRVVHEVNNPLAIIKNYLSVLDNKLAKREPVIGEMSILNEEIDRVGQLISGLAEMPADARSGTADCARVAEDVLRLFQATEFVPPSVQLVANVGREPAQVLGDADIIKQILVNLVKNAIEALAGGGRIEIANRGHVNRERRVYVELVVSDNGPGMSPEVMANLFSAVRSSKEGANHGLGLSIVHALVRKMDGMISCRSGRAGTSFEILLPACGGASSVAGAASRLMDSV
jgi:signal transduction histidine kinase